MSDSMQSPEFLLDWQCFHVSCLNWELLQEMRGIGTLVVNGTKAVREKNYEKVRIRVHFLCRNGYDSVGF
jgi:hypothetical protein